jgi:hypothetical protein
MQVGVLALLPDGVDDAAGEVRPVDAPLRHRLQEHALVPQRLDPVAGLQRVEAAEPVLVPAQHAIEVAEAGGVGP